MKTNYVRIIALIVTGALIAAGYLTIFPQPQKILENGAQEVVDDEDYLAPYPPETRGTRSGTSWPMFRNDLPHSGYTTSSVPDDNSILWTNTTGSGNGYGTPTVHDGRVFISSSDGYTYCFDLYTGYRYWRTPTASPHEGAVSSPAVANDHVVLFSSGDNTVYRLRVSDGGVDWTYPTGGGNYGGSSPAINNGRVYVGSPDRNLYCLNETTGDLIWSYTTDTAPIRSYGIQSSPAVANGRVFVGACDRYLYCFNESQPSAPAADYYWRTSLVDAIFGSPAVANGRVYCGSGYYNYWEGSGSHTMFCLDELTGGVIWTYLTGSDILSSPAIAYGNCYFTSTDGELYCVDALSGGPTPTLIWSNTTGDSWSSPSVADGRVVVGSRGTNRLYCYNASTGTLVWDYNAGNRIDGSPAIADGKVVAYVRGSPESVICFGYSVTPTVDSIEVRNQPGGGGSLITDQNVGVGTIITGYAAAYNSSTGYMYDIPVDWTVINGGGANASTSPESSVDSSDFYSGFFGGTATWLAADGSGHTDMVVFTVIPPEVDSIEIVDTPGIGAPAIADQSVPVGYSATGYAAGFNDTIGYIGNVSVTWSVLNSSGASASTFPTGGTSSVFDAGTAGGTAAWTADYGGGISDMVTLTISPPTVDFIIIVDTNGTGASEILDQIVDVGFTLQGYAAGFNDTSGYIGVVVVNWSVSNLIGATAYTTPPQAANSTFHANLSGGNAIWTADDGNGHTDMVQFTISTPSVDYIQIVDTPGTGLAEITGLSVDVGVTIQGYAAGFNNTAGYIGDISVTWSVINTNGAAGFTTPTTGTGSILNVGLLGGNVEWIADDGSGHTDSVLYTVNAPEIDYIIIRSGPNGTGSWVGASTYTFGQTDTFFAAGYNNTAGWVTDVPAAWSSDYSQVGNVSAAPSNSTTFTAVNNGTCNITATYNSHTNTTGIITIIYFTVDYIIIRDMPANGGSWVGFMFFAVGGGASFYVAAYNYSALGDGYIGDVTASWECSNTSVATVTSPGTSTAFSAQYASGQCNVTARYGSTVFNTTGILTVISATLDYIVITDWPDGFEIVDLDLGVGGSMWLYASGYNATGPLYLGLVEVEWSQAPSTIGSFTSSPSNSTLFTAGLSAGSTMIYALNSSLGVSDDFVLTVVPPKVDFIQIRDAAGGLGSIVTTGAYTVLETDEFYAAAYNRTSGYIQDVEVVWSSSAQSVGRVTSPGLWTNFTAQTVIVESSCTITATYSAQVSNATGLLTVMPLRVDYLQIRNAPGGAGDVIDSRAYLAFETDTFYAAAYNRSFGYLGDVEVEWSSSDNSVGNVSSPGSSTTFTAQDVGMEGTCNVTAVYDAQVSNTTGILTVSPVTVDFIRIRDGPNGGGDVVDDMVYIPTQTDIFYAAAYSNIVGYLYDVEVTWESNDTSVGRVSSPGLWTNFTAQWVAADGECRVTVHYSVGISNITGIFTVHSPRVDFIQVLNGSLAPVTEISLAPGDRVMFYAAGYNNTFGDMGYVNVTWNVSGSAVGISSPYGNLINITALGGGVVILTAMYDTGITDTVQITVKVFISPPTGVEVAQLPQGGALNISWNENPEENLAGYDIYISLSSTGPFTKINSELITTTTFIDEGLTNGIRYYYYILAVDTSGESSNPSEIASGIPDRDTDSDGTFDFIDEDDDNDNVPDVTEALWNTNPLIADSDGDGVDDGEDHFPTDPAKWDKPVEGEDISLMWILIPVIVLIVLLLLFFLLTRRQKPQEPVDELPPPPGALAEEDLPPPDDSEFPPPPEEDELPPPPEEGEFPPPPEKEEMPPPPEDETLPPPPPWLKKKAQLVPLDEDELPPPDD